MMNDSPEIMLNDLLARFNALQEALPEQLESLSNSLVNLEHRASLLEDAAASVEPNLGARLASEIQRVVEETRITLDNFSISMREYMTQTFALRNANNNVSPGISNIQPPMSSRQSRVKVKSPAVFTGKSSTCNMFFTQLALVFRAQPDVYLTDADKINYALTHVDQKVLDYFRPYLDSLDERSTANEALVLHDYGLFKQTIITAFGDSNSVYNAENELNRLKQTGSVAEYASNFRRITAVLKWNDDALRAYYKANLKDFVKDELCRRIEPITSLDEMISYTIDIDNRLFPRLKSMGLDKQPMNNRHSNNHHHRNSSVYNNRQNGSNQSSSNRPNRFHSSGPTPMDTAATINNSSSTLPRGPISEVLRAYRMTNNLCLYCGGGNHLVKDCRKVKGLNNQTASSMVASILEEQDSNFSRLNSITTCDSAKDPYADNDQQHLLVSHLNAITSKDTSEFAGKLLQGNLLPFLVKSMDRGLLVIPIELLVLGNMIRTYALVDSGASSSFISCDLVNKTGLHTYQDLHATKFKLADGTTYSSNKLTLVNMQVSGTHHQEKINLRLLPNAAFPVILGNSWLSQHDPVIHWRDGIIGMTCLHQKSNATRRCFPNELQCSGISVCYPSVQSIPSCATLTDDDDEEIHDHRYVYCTAEDKYDCPRDQARLQDDNTLVGSPTYSETMEHPVPEDYETDDETESQANEWRYTGPEYDQNNYENMWYDDEDQDDEYTNYCTTEEEYYESIADNNAEVYYDVNESYYYNLGNMDVDNGDENDDTLIDSSSTSTDNNNDDIISIESSPEHDLIDFTSRVPTPPPFTNTSNFFNCDGDDINKLIFLLLSKDYYSSSSNYNNLNMFCNDYKQNNNVSYLMSITAETNDDLTELEKIPPKYREFSKAFSKSIADQLPEHRIYDHKITLKPDTEVPFGPLYNLSETELVTLKSYLEENLSKGFIERSESPAGAPVLFVKKKDGSLRLCVDYRGLNRITVPNRCPLPLISETLDRLYGCTIFTKLDMRGAYNLLRIKKGDEWKTAFRTRYGHFQYKVMPFGLCNAPASFQAFVNDTLREYLDTFLVVYLDDILVFFKSEEEHTTHVKMVLKKLEQANLSLKLEKCDFDVSSVQFLGFTIGQSTIAMDEDKIAAIREWSAPKNVHDIQVFLGFSNFYRRFIKDYSKRCVALTALLKKNVPFVWSEAADVAFNAIKNAISSSPILRHYNPKLPCIIETDASDYALGAVCSQSDPDNVLHPIAFYSRKLLPAEINYQIYDKELLAIIAAFKHWRHYLEFSQESTVVITDHLNLKYFSSTRNLSRRQVRWSEILSDFNFTIEYRPGKQNAAADALSRKDIPSFLGGDDSSKTPMVLLKPELFVNTITQTNFELEINLTKKIKNKISTDEFFAPIIEEIKKGTQDNDNYSFNEDMLFHKGCICIPNDHEIKKTILEECHDTLAAGHFGITRTHATVSRNYYWPGMRKFIKDYVNSCDTCIRNKTYPHKQYGLLQPLPIPETP